jgi:hypothetical protein
MDGMEDAKTKAAQALDPLLAQFCTIEDQKLKTIWYFYDSGILEGIILDFASVSLDLKVEPDDDTVSFRVTTAEGLCRTDYVDVSSIEPWKELVGKPFCWGWVTINQQGYTDGILLSFDEIFPRVILNVIASSFVVGLISEMSKTQVETKE